MQTGDTTVGLDLKSLKERIENNKKRLSEIQVQIDSLEKKRIGRLKEVTRNNADTIAQKALLDIEKEMDLKKIQRKEIEKQIDNIIHQYLQYQREQDNLISDNIQEKLVKAREERDWLRSEIIPLLRRQLEEFEERKKELDSLVLSLSNQLIHVDRQKRNGQSPSEQLDEDI